MDAVENLVDTVDDVSMYESIQFPENYDVDTSGTDSAEEDPPCKLKSQYFSYSERSLPIIELTDKHQRTADSAYYSGRFVRIYSIEEIENGTRVIKDEVRKRMMKWSYVHHYEFSEGICEQKPNVLTERDLLNQYKIWGGYRERRKTVPLYFEPLFVLANRDLLSFTDFAESVDYYLFPVAYEASRNVSIKKECFMENLGCDVRDFQESLEHLDSLTLQLRNSRGSLNNNFSHFYSAKSFLRKLSFSLNGRGNIRYNSKTVMKLCRFRDFCNHALTVYLKSALETMEALISMLSTSNELFPIHRL